MISSLWMRETTQAAGILVFVGSQTWEGMRADAGGIRHVGHLEVSIQVYRQTQTDRLARNQAKAQVSYPKAAFKQNHTIGYITDYFTVCFLDPWTLGVSKFRMTHRPLNVKHGLLWAYPYQCHVVKQKLSTMALFSIFLEWKISPNNQYIARTCL